MKNCNDKTVYGIGYVGYGKYSYKTDKQVYKKWAHMLTRCYDGIYNKIYPTYEGCYVCEEWHNFQNFAKWYYDNIWDYDGVYSLDKDILIKGNKCYSPQTCLLVNVQINSLFTKNNADRGDLPIGVTLDKRYNQYRAYIYNSNGSKSTKAIKTNVPKDIAILQAFEIYKNSKEQYIKSLADLYKNKYPKFPNKIYQALYDYKVEITD